MRIEAILFDFDGTLAPNLDLPDMRRRVIELTNRHGVPDHVFQGRYIVEIIDAAQAYLCALGNQADYFESAHQLIRDIELGAAQATRPFPGVRKLLACLRGNGLKTGIVTRNCREAVQSVFPDVLLHVDALHARDDTEFLKPDHRHITTHLECLGVDAARAVMVGDGALDMHVGRALNMTCIGVLTGSADRHALTEAGAHVVLESCLELTDLNFD